MSPGARPHIDLDLGHACQYGYHQAPVRVTAGPPDVASPWRSRTRARLATKVVVALIEHDAMTTADLAAEIGTDQPDTLRHVLTALAARGELEQIAAPRFQPCQWRLAA